MALRYNPFTGRLDYDGGAQGPAGAPGSKWLADSGGPSNILGANGDFYLDTATGDIYGPKTAGAWGSSVYNIAEGQQGPPGSAGAPGEQGVPGASFLGGSGVPDNATVGFNGDFYFNTDNGDIYGPKAAGLWGSPVFSMGTDLAYNSSTRVLSSSSGDDVTLPLVTSSTPGLARPQDFGDVIVLACSDETADLATGTARVTFRMPWAATLTAVRLSVNTAPTGSALIVDVNEGGASVFSTRPQIDASAKTSVGSTVTPVISDASLAADAEITVDIDQVGSTIKGKGLKVALYVTRA